MNTVLRNSQRVIFDPKNKEHLSSLKRFLETGSWGQVQFLPELPYLNVPETVFRKYAIHNLQKVK